MTTAVLAPSVSGVQQKIPTYVALAIGAIALAICILLAKETKKIKKDVADTKRSVSTIQSAPPPKQDESKVEALEKKLQVHIVFLV